jgi:hypothetical protein
VLVTEAIALGGAEIASGSKLPAIFAEAGLPSPSLRMTTIVGAGANSKQVVQRMANLVISLLPTMQERGLVGPNGLDPGSLAQLLADDVTASASFVAAGSEVTAFTCLPTRAPG